MAPKKKDAKKEPDAGPPPPPEMPLGGDFSAVQCRVTGFKPSKDKVSAGCQLCPSCFLRYLHSL